MSNLYQLVYGSCARRGFTKAKVRAMLRQSRDRNAMLGITGLLLYQSGRIVQLLEGEERTVHALFNKIRQDPRHGDLATLQEGPIPARQYPQWTMGFRDISEGPDFSGLPETGESPLARDLAEAQRMLLHLGGKESRLSCAAA